jgi:hypothetical protein
MARKLAFVFLLLLSSLSTFATGNDSFLYYSVHSIKQNLQLFWKDNIIGSVESKE